jgi:hypothetical protein
MDIHRHIVIPVATIRIGVRLPKRKHPDTADAVLILDILKQRLGIHELHILSTRPLLVRRFRMSGLSNRQHSHIEPHLSHAGKQLLRAGDQSIRHTPQDSILLIRILATSEPNSSPGMLPILIERQGRRTRGSSSGFVAEHGAIGF